MLPRMSAEELKELDRMLSLKLPTGVGARPAQPPESVGAKPERSVFRPLTLDRRQLDIKPSGPRRPDFASPPAALPNTALTKIAGLTAEDIRKPPSIYVCLEQVSREIQNLIRKTDINYAQVLEAFQRSPLYRDYLGAGIKLINNDPTASMSHEEFEAITDFHESLKNRAK